MIAHDTLEFKTQNYHNLLSIIKNLLCYMYIVNPDVWLVDRQSYIKGGDTNNILNIYYIINHMLYKDVLFKYQFWRAALSNS